MTTKLTKNSLIEHLKGEAVGLSDGDSKMLLNQFFKTLEEETENGSNVKFHKFGTFKSKKYASRKAKNFKTGEAIETKKQVKISFNPSKLD